MYLWIYYWSESTEVRRAPVEHTARKVLIGSLSDSVYASIFITQPPPSPALLSSTKALWNEPVGMGEDGEGQGCGTGENILPKRLASAKGPYPFIA